MKTGTYEGEEVLAPEWVDSELTENIDTRRSLNRERKDAQKREQTEEVQNYWKHRYEIQKKITHKLTEEKKGGWEKRKSQGSKRNKR